MLCRGKDALKNFVVFKIIDFGLVTKFGNESSGGTMIYTSPEIFKDEKKRDGKADSYAFANSFYTEILFYFTR